jgi:hypothetical protein
VVARSVEVGLRPLAYWDCGFEFRLGHGCVSFVIVTYCQATVRSLVQRSLTGLAFVHVCVCVYVNVCLCECMCMCVCECMCMYVYVHVCACMCMRVYV